MNSHKQLVILVHGFNVKDGGFGTVERLTPLLASRADKVVALRYGYFGFMSTYYLNDGVAVRLSNLINLAVSMGYYKITVIGHSNGCAIMHRASYKLIRDIKIDQLQYIYINPALDREKTPNNATINQLHVLYSPDDKAVKLTKLIPRKLRKNWGQMGRKGVSPGIMAAIGSPISESRWIKQYQIYGGHSFLFSAEGLVLHSNIICNIVGEQQWENWKEARTAPR